MSKKRGASHIDEIERLALRAYDRNKEKQFDKLARELICCLYKVGAIGIKIGRNTTFQYSFRDAPSISAAQIGPNTKVSIVPMLASILNTKGRVKIAA